MQEYTGHSARHALSSRLALWLAPLRVGPPLHSFKSGQPRLPTSTPSVLTAAAAAAAAAEPPPQGPPPQTALLPALHMLQPSPFSKRPAADGCCWHKQLSLLTVQKQLRHRIRRQRRHRRRPLETGPRPRPPWHRVRRRAARRLQAPHALRAPPGRWLWGAGACGRWSPLGCAAGGDGRGDGGGGAGRGLPGQRGGVLRPGRWCWRPGRCCRGRCCHAHGCAGKKHSRSRRPRGAGAEGGGGGGGGCQHTRG